MAARLIEGLNQNLANLADLAQDYKQAHWNVVGPNFSELHELFDEFADETRGYADLVAERAVTLGGLAHGTVHAAAERSKLGAFPLDERDEKQLLEGILGRLEQTNNDLRREMDASADEAATQDLYIDVVRGIEKQRWMIWSHLQRR
jgi:starvation-inducible DNA-binding protein